MAVLTETDSRQLAAVIEKVARQLAPQYSGIVEGNDIAQELWVWALTKGEGARELYLAGHTTVKLFHTQLTNAGMKWCESQRKAGLGYDWRDDYNYSRPEVARLLPMALDPSTIPGLSGGGLHDGPSAKSDPAYGGGMLASIVDVRTAFSKLSDVDQAYVKLVLAHDLEWEKVGEEAGIQANSAYSKWMKVLDKLVTKHLGRG